MKDRQTERKTGTWYLTFFNFYLLLVYRKFLREFKMPEGVLQDQIASSYSSEGILTISAPRVIKAPEGATVQEAMAAASKAYTTDDGKTAVKQVILYVFFGNRHS